MKNKDKTELKNCVIDGRFKYGSPKFIYFGYDMYYGYPVNTDQIEVYSDIDSDLELEKAIKEVITKFLNLDNNKEYPYGKPIYKSVLKLADGSAPRVELFLSEYDSD